MVEGTAREGQVHAQLQQLDVAGVGCAEGSDESNTASPSIGRYGSVKRV